MASSSPAIELNEEPTKTTIKNWIFEYLQLSRIKTFAFIFILLWTLTTFLLSISIQTFNSHVQISSEKDGKDGKKESLGEVYTDEQITKTIDSVFEMMDKNNDGFVDYHEFVTNNKVK